MEQTSGVRSIEKEVAMIYMMELIVVEALLLWFALRSDGPYRTRGLIAVNMLLIALMASKWFEIFGHVTNVANVFYATVVVAQAYIFSRYGLDSMVRTIPMTLYALVVGVTLAYLTSLTPVVDGNIVEATAISTVAAFSLTVVAASFFAFIIGQAVLAVILGWVHLNKTRYLLAIVAAQLVDSAVFFSIAFSNSGIVGDAMITGFLLKVAVSLPIFLIVQALLSIDAKAKKMLS